jgi:hypothetical protein
VAGVMAARVRHLQARWETPTLPMVLQVGDYLAGTYVVDCKEGRERRVLDMYEMEELAMLERRLRHVEAELESAG